MQRLKCRLQCPKNRLLPECARKTRVQDFGIEPLMSTQRARDDESLCSRIPPIKVVRAALSRDLAVRHGIRLTRHKISDQWRGRLWLLVECGSHRKRERRAASGSLDRDLLDGGRGITRRGACQRIRPTSDRRTDGRGGTEATLGPVDRQ